jgi:hypothetical protein
MMHSSIRHATFIALQMPRALMALCAAFALQALMCDSALATCKAYATKGEVRSGAIGQALDDHNLDAIAASDAQPCLRDGDQGAKPGKTPIAIATGASSARAKLAPTPKAVAPLPKASAAVVR